MAFFSEVKARLGLDISPFEKGMAKASATAKNTSSEMGKNLAGVKGLIGFAAIAGGFRSALERAKELRDTAAETGTALDPAVQRAADLADNLERGQNALSDAGITTVAWLQRSVDYSVAFVSQMLGLVDGVDEGIKAIDEGRAKEAKAAQDAKKNADAKKKEDAEKKKASDDAAAAEAANIKTVGELMKKEAEITETARQKTLSIDQKIKEAQDAIVSGEAEYANKNKTAIEQGQALVRIAQAKSDLADLLIEKKKQEQDVEEELLSFFGDVEKSRAKAEEKRTDELKDQQKTLLDQKKTIEQTLAAQEKGKRASLEDITSGKRNVGGKTRADAKRLQALAKEEQRQIDAVSQAEDALATPTPSGEGQAAIDDAAAKAKQASSGASRADKEKELARRRDALAATQARKASLEKSLSGKVSDDFGKQQVEELKAVNTQLGKVNTALAPASIKSNK